MIQLTDKIFAVKVPENMNAFKIDSIPEIDFYQLDCYELGEYDEPIEEKSIDLPPGSYTFLFCTSEVTEEQARKVVLKDGIFCRNYLVRNDGHPFGWTDDPLESLETLLASKGCEGNWAVVRKK